MMLQRLMEDLWDVPSDKKYVKSSALDRTRSDRSKQKHNWGRYPQLLILKVDRKTRTIIEVQSPIHQNIIERGSVSSFSTYLIGG